jgi:hypothetical protein
MNSSTPSLSVCALIPEHQLEPIDVEDDPNLLNELHANSASAQRDASLKGKFKRDEVEISHKDEINLQNAKQQEKRAARRYAFD